MATSSWILPLLATGWLLAVLLGVLLWSSRSQRYTRLRPEPLAPHTELLPAVQGLTRSWVVGGNAVELLENGDEFYPALLRDVEAARDSIHIEVYAWWRGRICDDVAAALSRQARRGVEVRLLVDALGSWTMDPKLVDAMERSGCRIARYHDFRLRTLGRLNKRDHRKLAIFDGRVGYIFGHGLSKLWEGRADHAESWRDLAARVRGPVVSRVQSVFVQNWMEETAELLADHRYFPDQPVAGDVDLHVVSSSPRGGVSNASLLYRLMIGTAQRELVIQNPYFAPGPEVVDMMCEACHRGVRVRLLLPGPITDSRVVQYAGQHLYERLLLAGVEIWRFQTTLNHQKCVIVDGCWSYLGSANFDERSFDINAEVGLGILDTGIAEKLTALFEKDLESSLRMDLERWRRRSLLTRLVERASFLVHDQL